MRAESTAKHMLNSLIPITRFNRGEASKIFDEVNAAQGEKVVLKNNTPICVLMTPSHYAAIMDALEDYALYIEAEKRMVKPGNTYIPADEVLSGLGINRSDLDDVEVEIE
ncbi:MAG: type II toxin-antitoxin system Phd/YefM family antitoxin [Saccharofermentanales bacterium]